MIPSGVADGHRSRIGAAGISAKRLVTHRRKEGRRAVRRYTVRVGLTLVGWTDQDDATEDVLRRQHPPRVRIGAVVPIITEDE